MISSSKFATERALDSMLVVYSLLEGHPASTACSQFISERTGWFTSVLMILEAKAILTKVYGVSAELVSQKLAELVSGPIIVEELDSETTIAAFGLADSMGLDLPDAVLLHSALRNRAQWIATEDQKLSQSCRHFGLIAESPFDPALRQQVAAWEMTHLPAKGLPRVLRQVHAWLENSHSEAARNFWSMSGGGSHLP